MRQMKLMGPLLVCTFLLQACGDEPYAATDQGSGEDHFILESFGKRSLRATLREDGHEVFIEALYRPYRGIKPDVDPYCVRVVDKETDVFLFKHNNMCPAGWDKYRGTKEGVADLDDVKRRNAMMQRLYAALKSADTPPKRGKAKEESEFLLLDTLERIGAADPGNYDASKRVLPSPSLQIALDGANAQGEVFLEEEAGAESDPTGPNDEAAPGVTPIDDADDDVLDEENADEPLYEQPSASSARAAQRGTFSLFSKGSEGIPRTSPTQYVRVPGRECRQRLWLFSQPTKSMLKWGWNTRKHHSATIIHVECRAEGSNDPFVLEAKTVTANHGAAAGRGNMREYAFCWNFPVTVGYYIWKGECEGRWGTHHLCNDDTAYQVYNAFGEWNGGRRCLGKRRDHRPWCDKPW